MPQGPALAEQYLQELRAHCALPQKMQKEQPNTGIAPSGASRWPIWEGPQRLLLPEEAGGRGAQNPPVGEVLTCGLEDKANSTGGGLFPWFIEKGLEVSVLTERSAHGVLYLNTDSSTSLSPPSSLPSFFRFGVFGN